MAVQSSPARNVAHQSQSAEQRGLRALSAFLDVALPVDEKCSLLTAAPAPSVEQVYRKALDVIFFEGSNWWASIAHEAIAEAQTAEDPCEVYRKALWRIADSESGESGWIAHDALADAAVIQRGMAA